MVAVAVAVDVGLGDAVGVGPVIVTLPLNVMSAGVPSLKTNASWNVGPRAGIVSKSQRTRLARCADNVEIED